MTVYHRFPENKNFLQASKYELVFDRAPHISYFCQSFPLPGISLTEIQRETPLSTIKHAGDKAIYDPLSITFIVDEDMRTWREIHDWIRALTFVTDFAEYRTLTPSSRFGNKNTIANDNRTSKYSDATLIIYTSHNNSNIKVKFRNCFPTSLSQITFSTQDTADLVPISDASISYDYFDFV